MGLGELGLRRAQITHVRSDVLGELHQNNEKKIATGFGVLFLHKFLGSFRLPGTAGLPVKCADPTIPKLSEHRISIEKLLGEACSRCCMEPFQLIGTP